MSLHTCTECVFDVDDDFFLDDTAYIYRNGDVRVAVGPYVPLEKWPGRLEKAMEVFRLSTPEYELVDHRDVDRPVAGTELLAHRMGGTLDRFELNLFWPLNGSIWVFRARAPRKLEEVCWRVADSFLATYEPTKPMEALDG